MASMETTGWQKALIAAGGALAVGGLLWYLLREEDESSDAPDALLPKHHFKVTDPKKVSIGVREGPDLDAARTGQAVPAGAVFGVSEIVEGKPPQRYLKLAPGQIFGDGWVFTHSGRDGRALSEEISVDEAREEMMKWAAVQAELEAIRAEPNPMTQEEMIKSAYHKWGMEMVLAVEHLEQRT
eukprot:TRINITY_DN91152_c0_g1_i1.p1 TRINITY_DN91152_c0_g1~~TRINITY_DN91152_c0_g1_i1.p1  ORF type:complete len:206 (-),score=41.14 TRINITY_DN91152_c0_g1_i1:101-649(-)